MQNHLYPPHHQSTNSPAPSATPSQARTKAKAPPPPPLLNPQHTPPPAPVQARTKAMAPAPPVQYAQTAPGHTKIKAMAPPPPPLPPIQQHQQPQQPPVANLLASSPPSFKASPPPSTVLQGAPAPDTNSKEMVIQELLEVIFFWVQVSWKFPWNIPLLVCLVSSSLKIASWFGVSLNFASSDANKFLYANNGRLNSVFRDTTEVEQFLLTFHGCSSPLHTNILKLK